MSTQEVNPTAFKHKKSVALSGTPAGNTALCTVGHSGNDLHYRGYDIHDLASHCEFEEVAYLLVHGKLPTTHELTAYKEKLHPLRSLPSAVKQRLSCCRRRRIPWTCCAPASACSAAWRRKPQPTTTKAPARSPIVCSPACLPCSATGCNSRATANASKSKQPKTPSPRISCICCTERRRARNGQRPCRPR